MLAMQILRRTGQAQCACTLKPALAAQKMVAGP
ncbi:hypothetical protein RD1_3324 [Roseobacter denitrificans OCh 114]|uniref:Uncharacterized protein n=1 Tax=Roseobacter denitrificans (strain ATCC 33942 / OCh 114) TaxID=375451 RepID=Q163M0_ROSDO|nr:hypothetical protein RD1_3324 [Roseobacter denitrificans OCh 114]